MKTTQSLQRKQPIDSLARVFCNANVNEITDNDARVEFGGKYEDARSLSAN